MKKLEVVAVVEIDENLSEESVEAVMYKLRSLIDSFIPTTVFGWGEVEISKDLEEPA